MPSCWGPKVRTLRTPCGACSKEVWDDWGVPPASTRGGGHKMADEIRMTDPLAQPSADTSVSADRTLTKDNLEKINVSLNAFEKALAATANGGHNAVGAESKGKSKQGNAAGSKGSTKSGRAAAKTPAALHCLVVTGYLGTGYGT